MISEDFCAKLYDLSTQVVGLDSKVRKQQFQSLKISYQGFIKPQILCKQKQKSPPIQKVAIVGWNCDWTSNLRLLHAHLTVSNAKEYK